VADTESREFILMNIKELCGLAGVKPDSRRRSEWLGSVTFSARPATAKVSYTIPGLKNKAKNTHLSL